MDEFERQKTRVQWLLGNKCNFNCNYCLDIFKRGDRAFVSNDLLIEVCKDITYHYDDLGRDVIFEFMGGEPTLMDSIPELGNRLSNFPTNLILYTNGSAPLEWWQKTRRYLTGVTITIHKNFSDIPHIRTVIEYLQGDDSFHPIDVKVLIAVTHQEDHWAWGMTNLRKFRKRFGIGDIQLLYSNFGRGSNMYFPYSEKQWLEYNRLYEIEHLAKPGASPIIEYESFKGYTCYAGIDTLTIDSYGNVFRGWCNQGGKIGNIHEMPIEWPKEPVVCSKETCMNGFDRVARKER